MPLAMFGHSFSRRLSYHGVHLLFTPHRLSLLRTSLDLLFAHSLPRLFFLLSPFRLIFLFHLSPSLKAKSLDGAVPSFGIEFLYFLAQPSPPFFLYKTRLCGCLGDHPRTAVCGMFVLHTPFCLFSSYHILLLVELFYTYPPFSIWADLPLA